VERVRRGARWGWNGPTCTNGFAPWASNASADFSGKRSRASPVSPMGIAEVLGQNSFAQFGEIVRAIPSDATLCAVVAPKDLRQQRNRIKRDGQTSPARDRRPVVAGAVDPA
jgi:hypothetical protein